jgi:hypothetical protein
MSAYVVFTHIRTRDWIIDHSTSVNSRRRRVIKDSLGVESLVNHMRPRSGKTVYEFMRVSMLTIPVSRSARASSATSPDSRVQLSSP